MPNRGGTDAGDRPESRHAVIQAAGRGAGRFQGVVRRASHDRPGGSEGQRCPSPDH